MDNAAFVLDVTPDEVFQLKFALKSTIDAIRQTQKPKYGDPLIGIYYPHINIYTVIAKVSNDDADADYPLIGLGASTKKGYSELYKDLPNVDNDIYGNLWHTFGNILNRYRNTYPRRSTLYFHYNEKEDKLAIYTSGSLGLATRVFYSA